MTALHDLSAEALSKAYRTRRTLAGRGDARLPRPHRCLGSQAQRDVHRLGRAGARAGGCSRRHGGAPACRSAHSTACRSPSRTTSRSPGIPAPLGTAAGDMSPCAQDAPPVARVREAGCVFLGKTTMPDYGMLVSGVSSLHGTTRNPWNTTRNPGGSSSGAGAGNGGRLCAARARHRHRRIGAAARRL